MRPLSFTPRPKISLFSHCQQQIQAVVTTAPFHANSHPVDANSVFLSSASFHKGLQLILPGIKRYLIKLFCSRNLSVFKVLQPSSDHLPFVCQSAKLICQILTETTKLTDFYQTPELNFSIQTFAIHFLHTFDRIKYNLPSCRNHLCLWTPADVCAT